MNHIITPAVGQIWKDRAKSCPFLVRIESIDNTGNGWAIVQPVEFDGTIYKAKRHSKPRETLLSRFDGRSQGLDFYMEAP